MPAPTLTSTEPVNTSINNTDTVQLLVFDAPEYLKQYSIKENSFKAREVYYFPYQELTLTSA